MESLIDILRKDGFINTEQAGAIIGEPKNANVHGVLHRAGCHSAVVSGRGLGSKKTMWKESDVKDYAERLKSPVVGGEHNGGKLLARIDELEKSLSELAARVQSLETFKLQF